MFLLLLDSFVFYLFHPVVHSFNHHRRIITIYLVIQPLTSKQTNKINNTINIQTLLKQPSLQTVISHKLFIHSSIHFFFINSFIHPFIHSFINSFIPSFIHSFIHFFIHSFIYSFIHQFIHSSIHSFIHSFIHPFI